MLGPLALQLLLGAAPPFSFTPPPGFHEDLILAATQTDALAPPVEGEAERHLEAYFDTGPGAPGASSLSLSTVESPLELDANARTLLASATAGYFRTKLDLPFELDHTALTGSGPSRRVEVWGQLTLEGRPRTTVVAFFPGIRAYTVAVASMPAEQAERLSPQIEASLESFVAREQEPPWMRSRTAISLAVWGLAGLVLAGFRFARRKSPVDDQGPT